MGTDIGGRVEVQRSDDTWVDSGLSFEDGRNYLMYAVLAGVQNRTGLQPIDEPRGLPDDLRTKAHYGDHSCSWLYLPEVAEWPGWEQPTRMSGLVSPLEFERLATCGGEPVKWCSAINDTRYRAYEWDVVPKEYAKPFYTWIQYLRAKFEGVNVRLVFGFDS